MNRDLEEFLASYSGLVLINLWDRDSESSLLMDQVMQEFERITGDKVPPILRLIFSENRDWAKAHQIYGTPAMVVYYRGQPLFRLIGKIDLEDLLKCLREHDL